MISGEFGSIAIDTVVVDRAARIRKEIKEEDVEVLAESISRNGLIHPICLNRDRILVAGETRLRACKSLGWTHISFQWFDELNAQAALAIELEENIKRKDLTWQDQCDALLKFHNLQAEAAKEEGLVWSVDETARAIGYSPKTVTHQLMVAREIASGNERVAAAKEYSTARGITTRANERRASDEFATLALIEDVEALDLPAPPILTTNFLEWVHEYTGPAFNFIHCDFPYGINADKFGQGAADSYGGYEDSPETYWALVNSLCENKDKLLGVSGHIIFWFSMRYYTETLAALRKHFWVDPYPLVWHKSDNKGTLPDPQRGPRRVYEVAFLCSHGDRKIIASVSNTFSGPTLRSGDHMSEKSEDMLTHFFRMLVDGQTRMLDPTCGSGSAIRAAMGLGATALGLEVNPEFADNARRALDANGQS